MLLPAVFVFLSWQGSSMPAATPIFQISDPQVFFFFMTSAALRKKNKLSKYLFYDEL